MSAYPEAKTKARLLRYFVSIIARTEERMSESAQRKIEEILRASPLEIFNEGSDTQAGLTDFLEEGRNAYKELKRRTELDKAPPNEGDVLSRLKRDGSIVRDRADPLMREWLRGATEKYNESHSNAPIMPGDAIGNGSGIYTGYGVITRGIVFPTQLYGGGFYDSLIVPADVPRPKGRRHNTTIFYLSDFTCEGNFPPFCKY